MLLIFDDNYDIIYGQWINICNQTDRRNFLGLNFADNIYFVLKKKKKEKRNLKWQ